MKKTMSSKVGAGLIALGAVVVGSLAFAALSPLAASARADDKVFSHTFKAVKPADVLAWMKQEGIKVEVDEYALPEKMLTLVFDGATQDSVVNTFAKLTGFQTEKKGDVYSLLKGVDTIPANEGVWVAQDKGDAPVKIEMDEEPELAFIMQDNHEILNEVMAALEESGVSQAVREKVRARLEEKLTRKMVPHFKMEGFPKFEMLPPMKVRGEAIEIPEMDLDFEIPDMEGLDVDIPDMEGFAFEIPDMEGFELSEPMQGQESVREALQQAMQAIARAMRALEHAQAFGPEGEKQLRMTEKILKEENKALRHIDENKLHEKMRVIEKDEMKKHMADMEKHMAEMRKKFGEEGKFKLHMEGMNEKLGEGMKILKIKMENLKKFIKSLTDEQKELADKQGYLRPEDLTKEQRELLDLGEGKDVDLNFNVDGDSIRIKSGKGETKKVSYAIGA